jgi:flagellar hook protein FlgE
MLRSLYSGISGLRAHQTMMDVTGNNISNVNTVGFKTAQTIFQDTLSQLVATAGKPQEAVPATVPPTFIRGGINAAQIGLGVKLADITNNFRQGAAQMTGNGTDVMINADGFFVVQEVGQTLYTRSGAFKFDANGDLVTPTGAFVLGYEANPAGGVTGPSVPPAAPTPLVKMSLTPDPALLFPPFPAAPAPTPQLTSYSISSTGEIIGAFSDDEKRTLGQIAMATFANPGGLEKAGNSMYRADPGVTGPADEGLAGTGQRGTMTSGALEMSNVDLAQEFTNLIVAQRGFQANARVITTSDELLQELVNLKR